MKPEGHNDVKKAEECMHACVPCMCVCWDGDEKIYIVVATEQSVQC